MTQQYTFADAADEERRLRAQGDLLDPLTARLLTRAGLAPGMRVLDVGCGVGNVSMLVAESVGPGGSVLGIDSNPAAVERARRLCLDLANVEFRVADVCALDDVGDGFDAVVGRSVLMYLADPAAALREATGRLRPGGLVCMHEPDITYIWTTVDTPLWRQVREWLLGALAQTGGDPRMGLSLMSTFRAAGLPDPELALEAPAGSGSTSPAFGWANSVAALLPLLERLGIASPDEVEIETLTQRLNDEVDRHDGFVLGPPMIGAWTRLPS